MHLVCLPPLVANSAPLLEPLLTLLWWVTWVLVAAELVDSEWICEKVEKKVDFEQVNMKTDLGFPSDPQGALVLVL